MELLDYPDDVYKHRGDTDWLETHGRAALDAYVKRHPPDQRRYAREAFVKDMFKDPDTCALFARAPLWWHKEFDVTVANFKTFAADLQAAIGVKNKRAKARAFTRILAH